MVFSLTSDNPVLIFVGRGPALDGILIRGLKISVEIRPEISLTLSRRSENKEYSLVGGKNKGWLDITGEMRPHRVYCHRPPYLGCLLWKIMYNGVHVLPVSEEATIIGFVLEQSTRRMWRSTRRRQ